MRLVSDYDDAARISHFAQGRAHLKAAQTRPTDDNTRRAGHQICLGGMLTTKPSNSGPACSCQLSRLPAIRSETVHSNRASSSSVTAGSVAPPSATYTWQVAH